MVRVKVCHFLDFKNEHNFNCNLFQREIHDIQVVISVVYADRNLRYYVRRAPGHFPHQATRSPRCRSSTVGALRQEVDKATFTQRRHLYVWTPTNKCTISYIYNTNKKNFHMKCNIFFIFL